jgi:uncharacterized protein YndB with AHSA1/START domain
MYTIHLERTLRAPAERVFDVLADHAGYVRFPWVRSAKVVRPGTLEPNGKGAIREIQIGPAWFQEEITAFERPTRLEYRILRSRPPIAHQLGRLTFTPVAEGVRVAWTSTFQVTLPLVGRLVSALGTRMMSNLFDDALRLTEQLGRYSSSRP